MKSTVAPFTSPEARAAMDYVKAFVLANAPPRLIDEAAFDLVGLAPDEIEAALANILSPS
jgi:hypothetical protein